MTSRDENGRYYVYLYRDPESLAIRYVGVGTERPSGAQRVEDHLRHARRAEFRAWLARLERRKMAPLIDVMPCRSRDEALAVEAGLISALWTPPRARGDGELFNAVHGHHGQFAPLGLSAGLAQQRYKPALTRPDLQELGGAIAVIVSTKDFAVEGRPGAAPRWSLPDSQVSERILGWWQIGGYIERWNENIEKAPRLLLGVTGPVSRRWVWGSVQLTQQSIRHAERDKGGLYRFDLSEPSVNSRKLRGRRLAPDAVGPRQSTDGRRLFGGIRSQFFDVIEAAS